MKVFISWSGEPSQKVAEILRIHLPQMIQSLEPFMSKHDLSSGGRWAHQLSQELEQSSFGIICLTPDNLAAPWLLFEAGALTKHVEGRACCLLLKGLGPTDVSDPLAQFQNRRFVKEEFWQLLVDLNKHLEKSLDPGNLQAMFENWWWPDVEKKAAAALASVKVDAPKEPKRGQADLLEELLVRVRT